MTHNTKIYPSTGINNLSQLALAPGRQLQVMQYL